MSNKNQTIVATGVVVALLAIGIGGWMYASRKSSTDIQNNTQSTGSTSDFSYTKDSEGSRKHVEDTKAYHIEALYPDSAGLTGSSDHIAVQTMELYVRQGITDFKNSDAG